MPSLKKKKDLFLYSPPPLPYLIPWHPRKLIIYQILSKMTMKKQRTNALLTTLLPHYNQSCLQSIQHQSIQPSTDHPQLHSYQQIHSLYSSNLYTPLHIRSIIHSSFISTAHHIRSSIISTDPSYPQSIHIHSSIISTAPSYPYFLSLYSSILYNASSI